MTNVKGGGAIAEPFPFLRGEERVDCAAITAMLGLVSSLRPPCLPPRNGIRAAGGQVPEGGR